MEDLMEKIVSLAKRRGFVFPNSEIYGGFNAGYDFGPLGTAVEKNIRAEWRKAIVSSQPSVVEINTPVVVHPRVWEASGHLGHFSDQLVECKKCHHRFKEEEIKEGKCPLCGGELTSPRTFHLMMKSFLGPVEDEQSTVYLRPETCQGIFLNFKNVLQSQRMNLPFGIAQLGKAFRNEINPKNFIFRTREFEQMEMEWFCQKEEAEKWFDYWREQRLAWYKKLGIKSENIRVRETPTKELAHYAKKAADIEYHFPFGWQEIEGIHYRGNYDLQNHMEKSGEKLIYRHPETKEEIVPQVVEVSAGLERTFLAFLVEAYEEIEGGRGKASRQEEEVILHLSPRLAPFKAAVFPLLGRKKELEEKSREVFQSLLNDFSVIYDAGGSIGRRYRRQDEIGTPLAITIDFQSLEDETVTCRNRESMKQVRVPITQLPTVINQLIA
jgi:glycyl-tRNA synthetase